MYRFNYFTEKANHVINLAITSAEELGHNYIGSEHLLLGILKEDAGLGAQALRESGVQTEDVEKLIKENIGVGEPTRLTPDDFTPRFKRMLELAFQIARGMMHSFVGTEHLLLALLKETDSYGYKFLLALACARKCWWSSCSPVRRRSQTARPTVKRARPRRLRWTSLVVT